jgi:hypothetical protein
MLKFDCFIRPDANLSIIATKIGNYKIVISPKEYHWEGTRLVIDDVVKDTCTTGVKLSPYIS